MAACNEKMSRLLLFRLFLLLDLLKDAGRFIGSLTLLKKGNKPKQVHRHHFVCLYKLVLMRLRPRKEDLFALLLRCGQFHHLTDVATIKVAEELYWTLHECMHQHEGRLFWRCEADKLAGSQHSGTRRLP